MVSDGSGLPQPDLGVPSVPRQGCRQNDIAIVSGTGEKGHDRDLIRPDLIQNGVEARLTLMKRYRDLVKEPPASQRLSNLAYQRVGGRLAA
jgi:hypothetical protein